jgi:hypothetical protein
MIIVTLLQKSNDISFLELFHVLGSRFETEGYSLAANFRKNDERVQLLAAKYYLSGT